MPSQIVKYILHSSPIIYSIVKERGLDQMFLTRVTIKRGWGEKVAMNF